MSTSCQQDVGKGRIFAPHSVELQKQAEEEAKRVYQLAYDATNAILRENKDKLDAMAAALVEK